MYCPGNYNALLELVFKGFLDLERCPTLNFSFPCPQIRSVDYISFSSAANLPGRSQERRGPERLQYCTALPIAVIRETVTSTRSRP